jgi:hypothetical protein
MAQNKKLNIQPVALTTSAANYLNPKITTLTGGIGWIATQPYFLIRHVRAINTSPTPTTVSAWKGLTGGSLSGTEYMWSAAPIAGNGTLDWWGEMRLDSTDFLTALAGAATVTLNFDSAEIGFS